MKNKRYVFVFLFLFAFGTIASYASPLHEIQKKYESGGYKYEVAVLFFDRNFSVIPSVLKEMEGYAEEGTLFDGYTAKVVNERELKLAPRAFNDIKNDREFKEWAQDRDADYIFAVAVVNSKVGEYYIVTREIVGIREPKEIINRRAWVLQASAQRPQSQAPAPQPQARPAAQQPQQQSQPQPQNFSRILEVKNPRMNGQDVLTLQNRLLSAGFTAVGSADGYYGPLTSDVIKNIQIFSGFQPDGKVNRIFWDFIFNNKNDELLMNISIVSKYNEGQLRKMNADYMGHSTEGGNYEIYYSNDRKIKILKLNLYGEMGKVQYICHFISNFQYFIMEQNTRYSMPMGGGQWTEERTMYYMNSNRMYAIKDGVISQSNFRASFIDEISKKENLTF